MDVDFIIPLKKEDLLKDDSGCYAVNLISFKDALIGIRDLKFSIGRNGCDTVAEHFDVCFSFLYHTENTIVSQLQDFYEEVIEEYLKHICTYTEKSLNLDPTGKIRALNAIKKICYLFSLTLKSYEEKLIQKNENFIAEPKRSKLKSKLRLEDSWPWFDKKLEAFSVLYSFLNLPICNLWQSRVVEETLVNLIAGCCFKSFECNEINLVKYKPLKDSASQVLAILIVNYNYGLTFFPKSAEVMKQHEHSAPAIANTVLFVQRDFNCQTILEKILEELLDVSMEDPQTLGKPVATFITELGESYPDYFLPCVNLLTDFLSVDAYMVRNAVIITLTEMIIKCFSQDKLSDDLVICRNRILKELQNEIHDDNAFVRSKVVQLWSKLASTSCIPVNYYVPLLRNMGHRLVDKSIHVSKNAIIFFTTALEHNPYGGKLRLSELNKEKEAEITKLKQLMEKQPLPPEEKWAIMEIGMVQSVTVYFNQKNEGKEFPVQQDTSGVDIADIIFIIANLINQKMFNEALSLLQTTENVFPESREIQCNVDREDQVAYYVAALKKIYLRAAELNPQAIVPDYYDNLNKMESVRDVVKYLSNCSEFVEYINKGSETIYKLMFSTNTSEILESIEFFSKAFKFQIGKSEKAICDMLLLVNSNTPELKDAVAKAYGSLYLESSKSNARAKAAQVAHRLIYLTKSLDHDQKLALEELLQKWILTEQLDKEFISSLFERVVKESQSNTSSADCNAALVLIDIIAGVNQSVVSGNLNYLKDLLDSKFSNTTIKLVCSILQKLGSTKKNKKIVLYKKENEIFKLSTQALLDKFPKNDEPEFIDMAMSILDLIFKLCYKPEDLGNEIICAVYKKMVEHIPETDQLNESNNKKDVSEGLLEKLFFICGHTVFNKWQYCDRDVFNCLKRCQDGVVLERQADQSMEEYALEADNEVAADDNLYEEITYVCEKFLTEEDTLIHHISNIVVMVCQSPDDKVSQSLKASASLALAKFMFTSISFCEQQFQLFVTLMDRCKHEAVRSNMVLSFGDLLCRFPNVAEPWTQYLYSRLKDLSELVRLNTMSVLCYLISREMIKVRGQFAELLLHLEDPHPIIAEKVNSLLLDLSIKGNTIYNVIPDIITKLTNPERSEPVDSSTFKLIIGRLFELVTKERQSELLVEKLCVRLKESTNERQWEALVFCLSQIRYSEKSLRKLSDALPTFNEKLFHPLVHETLLNIINICMKSTKSSLKEIAQEASALLEELITGKNDESTTQVKEDKKLLKSKDNETDEEEAVKSETETPVKPTPLKRESKHTRKAPKTPRTTRKQTASQVSTRSTRKKKAVKYDDDDDSD